MTPRVSGILAVLLAPFALATTPALAQTADHLTCMRYKGSESKAAYNTTLDNAFGTLFPCIVKAPPKMACLPTAKSNVTPTPPGGGPSGEAARPVLCYRVKCQTKDIVSVSLTDQFGVHAGIVVAPKLLCAPASPGGAFLD
jgi:hypothetical protein